MEIISKIQAQKPKSKKEQIAVWREGMPALYRGTYDKAMLGKSRDKAIRAKCQDCQAWQTAEIPRCEIVTCPLHPYRPGAKRAQKTASGSKD